MKELREAKGFTHKDLAARINFTLKKGIEDALREQGKDMRSAFMMCSGTIGCGCATALRGSLSGPRCLLMQVVWVMP
jgi:hypothetical protein